MPTELVSGIIGELFELPNTDVAMILAPFEDDQSNFTDGLSILVEPEADINTLLEPHDEKNEILQELLLREERNFDEELSSDRESIMSEGI